MKRFYTTLLAVITALVLFISFSGVTGCGVYKFNDTGTLDSGVKTVYVKLITNEAPYVNPQLAPNLTERLKQKIVNQTKLRQVNNEADGDYQLTATIKDYSVSTSGVSTVGGRSQGSINRLAIGVHVDLYKRLKQDTEKFDVSRNFDYDANITLQSYESTKLDEIVKNVTDEIFNHIFSNW